MGSLTAETESMEMMNFPPRHEMQWQNHYQIMQPAFSLHCMHTPGTLQFRLGHEKGRWAHFNVKLHFLSQKVNTPEHRSTFHSQILL